MSRITWLIAVIATVSVSTARADLVPSSTVLADLRYSTELGDDTELSHAFAFGTRSRHMFGTSIRYCTGLDTDIGTTSTGLVYELELYALGAALPVGDDGFVSVCSGAGLSGVRGSIPFAWQFPVELGAEMQFGSIRGQGWIRTRWIAGEDLRQDGSDLAGFADELDLTVGVRLGANSRYWSRVTSGHGVFLGVNYREQGNANFGGIVIGLSMWGGHR